MISYPTVTAVATGWDIQDREAMNLFDPMKPGVAVREAHLFANRSLCDLQNHVTEVDNESV
ncbi:MAG: hypothetical protein GY943_22015 [Chloroflexi bacterium]|nr:hypothetical protein [Chloroflexota bacterium]